MILKETYITFDVGKDDLEERATLVLAEIVQKLAENGAALCKRDRALAGNIIKDVAEHSDLLSCGENSSSAIEGSDPELFRGGLEVGLCVGEEAEH